MTPDNDRLLPVSFYANPDVTDIARNLLGKVICSKAGGDYTSGIIIETEAYCGRDDKACHANNGKRTPRTEVMFGEPGRAYIYLCYGIHHLFNVVTNRDGLADAVLVRAVKPLEGVDIMKERRGMDGLKNLTNGPGKLTQAMGITTDLNRTDLRTQPVWIEDYQISVAPESITASKRIGVDYADEDALRPWRFNISPASL
ncbi:MAG: DNA-3-methyladenine glycosylase [Balneolaceae bacterium]|nr:DNA-3-methyladenine glycosylase [Balneolaceae bacterium]MCH8549709.1 DNA-3-methyladenine glycosylase [Balneolaceae bacterium]